MTRLPTPPLMRYPLTTSLDRGGLYGRVNAKRALLARLTSISSIVACEWQLTGNFIQAVEPSLFCLPPRSVTHTRSRWQMKIGLISVCGTKPRINLSAHIRTSVLK